MKSFRLARKLKQTTCFNLLVQKIGKETVYNRYLHDYCPYSSPKFKINAGKKRSNLLQSFPPHYDSLVSLSILAKAGRMLRMKQKNSLHMNRQHKVVLVGQS
jgi:hypothetical protein